MKSWNDIQKQQKLSKVIQFGIVNRKAAISTAYNNIFWKAEK